VSDEPFATVGFAASVPTTLFISPPRSTSDRLGIGVVKELRIPWTWLDGVRLRDRVGKDSVESTHFPVFRS